MRIISSDGKIDIQYEQAVVWLDYVDEKHCYIKAMTQQKEYCMAHYTNYENAEKAMQMLQDEYIKFQSTTDKQHFYFSFNYPRVFQFPADDELEVSE